MNHDFLFHKLLQIGIWGKVYNSIRAIYREPQSCVVVNDRLTDWFTAKAGVRQGDSLSPILFAIFINDLAHKLNELKTGLDIENHHLTILMYADDVILLAKNHAKAQEGLDVLSRWCATWGMKVNIKKSQVVHHRNP